jgi:hypothetical protein
MSHQGTDWGVEGKMTIFRPPIVRTGTAALNRALFSKTVDIAAAAVLDNKLISNYRKTLESGREILHADRISPIRPHPDKTLAEQGRKCLLLNPTVRPEGQVAFVHIHCLTYAMSVDANLDFLSLRHMGSGAQGWRRQEGTDGCPL